MNQAETLPTDLIISLQSVLFKPCRRYFEEILFGCVCAVGCITSWIHVGNNDGRYRKVYRFIARIGTQVDKIQRQLVLWLLANSNLFPIESPVMLVVDDTPVKRYGRKVEGAGRMHDPTNPHSRNAACYGHSLVMIGVVVTHPQYGTICLPVGWKFYVNENKLDAINEKIRPQFKKKHEIVAELLEEIVCAIRKIGRRVEIIFDRGYLAEDLFQSIHEMEAFVVTRFKKNNNLYEIPERPSVRRRGRPRKYGDSFKYQDLVVRNEGRMQRVTIECYGRNELVEFCSCVALSRMTDGRPIQVVVSRLIRKVKGNKESYGDWGLFISTDLSLTPEQIIQHYSCRFSIEEMFKELKETCGLGRQQTRKFESSLACATFVALGYLYVELSTWNVPHDELVKGRPVWDRKERRPSHRNKRDYCRARILPSLIRRKYQGSIPQKKLDDIIQTIVIFNAV